MDESTTARYARPDNEVLEAVRQSLNRQPCAMTTTRPTQEEISDARTRNSQDARLAAA
jgi:hypothetical protein